MKSHGGQGATERQDFLWIPNPEWLALTGSVKAASFPLPEATLVNLERVLKPTHTKEHHFEDQACLEAAPDSALLAWAPAGECA